MANGIKKIIPGFIKNYIKKQIVIDKPANKQVEISKPYFCPVCNQKVSHFDRLPDVYYELLDKYQFIHPCYNGETINVLKYSCPNCGAADRDRLYALYLNLFFEKIDKKIKHKFIDFAPAKSLSNFIKKNDFFEYRTADLFMEGVDDKVDLTNLNIYDDNSVDFFICSHMLEHIEEDIKAMKELFRVLKDTGSGILMVPINLALKQIYENPAITTEEGRWKHFGQNDHIRMYSKQGFMDRVKSVGFKINEYNIDFFGKETFEKNGIHPRSVLYVVSK